MMASARRTTPRAPRKKRIGVIGSLVWDVIHGRDARSVPVEEWGGITYTLSGLDAALPDDWEIVPIMKVGEDLAARAREFLRTLKHIAPDAALIEVPYPGAARRAALLLDDERRTEHLTRRRCRRGAGSRSSRCSTTRRLDALLHQLPQRLGARSRDDAADPAALPRPDPLRPAHDGVGGAAGRTAHAASDSRTSRSGAAASTSFR